MLRVVAPGTTGTLDMAHWLPLTGITYDPKGHTLYILLAGLTHRVARPDEIRASVDPDGNVRMLFVQGRDGKRAYLELSDHPLPYDPSTFRRDPSRRFGRRILAVLRSLEQRLLPSRAQWRQLARKYRTTPKPSVGDATRVSGSAGAAHPLRLPVPASPALS